MTSSRAWWRARRAWQKAALLLLPVAVAAVVLAVVLDSRSTPSVAERPAAEVRPEEPDLSRGLVVFDGCSLVDDAGVARDASMPAQVMALLPGGLDMKNLGVGGQTTQMMAADADTEVDPLYATSRRCNILVCWEGTNDLILGTAPPYDARQDRADHHAKAGALPRLAVRGEMAVGLPRIVRRRGAQDEVVGAFPAHEDVAPPGGGVQRIDLGIGVGRHHLRGLPADAQVLHVEAAWEQRHDLGRHAGVARDSGVVDQRAAVEDNEPAAEVWLFRPDLSCRPFGD